MAVTEKLPSAVGLMVRVATPLALTVAVPSVVPPETKVTVPVGLDALAST